MRPRQHKPGNAAMLGMLTVLLFTMSANAMDFMLTDRNSTVVIDPNSPLQALSWMVDGIDNLPQQAMWYRLDTDTREMPVGNLALATAGTYIYYDNLNEPINRLMGLHGVLVSMPRTGNTPYSNPTTQVQHLFNDLGASDHFPGDAWDGKSGLFSDGARTWVWVFHLVDSAKYAAVSNLAAGETMDSSDFLNGFLPDYFTINGKSGFFAAGNHDISLMGNVGEPALIRVVNTGLADASPHIHGNHVYMTSINGEVQDNVIFLDTWIMRPLDRKDILLPFVRPPDIPLAAWPPVEEKFPLRYPMHDHNEISQTAAGGNYPQGLVCHWQINGPLQT